MASHWDHVMRSQLTDRRQRLESAVAAFPGHSYLTSLLTEVDAALTRMDDGSYGLCEACHEGIEDDRLMADPLVRFCLDHLTDFQQRALQQDLELTARIQSGLLPRSGLMQGGWRTAFHYEPVGPVSGDYCDFIPAEDGSLYFVLGDVSGKGVAASMLMAHLQAMFRALTGIGLPLVQLMERASRLFCESTLSNQYATLVCGRAGKDGYVELCNAGHPSPLLRSGNTVRLIHSTGLPLGLFCSGEFQVDQALMKKGDCLLLYTDGVSEAQNPEGIEFGEQPLIEIVGGRHQSAQDLVDTCVAGVRAFRSGSPSADDLTVMALQRVE